MQVLVTGATGFIGSNVANSFAEKGYKVKALVRSIEKASGLLDGSKIAFVEGDITDSSTLGKAIDSGDVVVHLAARYNEPSASYSMYKSTNVRGTEHLIHACMLKQIERFIHCSTIGVAINAGSPPFDESSPYSPAADDFYEQTKAEGERLVLRYFRNEGFPAVVVRPAQPFGPGDMKKVKFYRMVKRGVMVGNGKVKKHLIYIDDLVTGIELAIQKKDIEGEIFILGGKPVISLNDMIEWAAKELNVTVPRIRVPVMPLTILSGAVEKACKLFKVSPPIYRSRLAFFTKSYFFNGQKAETILGFEPQVPIRDGIARTVKWYREKNLL